MGFPHLPPLAARQYPEAPRALSLVLRARPCLSSFNDKRGGSGMNLFARKAVVADEDMPAEHRLKRSLGWPHLVALGVGAIVGTGILTLTGVGAGMAGPGVILSFGIAGLICACAALAYAEMATMIPASGSAYTYSYVVIGELVAWVVGWSLILEYSLVVSAVAVGWSGHAVPPLLEAFSFPAALTHGPQVAGSLIPFTLHVTEAGINLPA